MALHISGTVQDTSGRPVDHAAVTATGPRGNATAVSNRSGRFDLAYPATGDVTAPLVGVTVRAQRLRTVLRHGLRATVSCTEPCTADVRLVLSRALARRYGLARRSAPTVAHRTVRLLRPGRLPLRLHLTRRAARALRNAQRITFTLRTSARDAAGNTRLRTTSVALLR